MESTGCCMVVHTIQECQAAEEALQSAVVAKPRCFIPADVEAAARSNAALAVENMAPALRALLGDSLGLRTQADVLDALSVRGRWDVAPLGTPEVVAVALVAAVLPKYCTDPDTFTPGLVDKLRDGLAGSPATPWIQQVRSILPRVRAFALNQLNVIPAARGVDYGVLL